MVSGHVFIGTSLDGFIARPDGDIAWLDTHAGTNEDHGYAAVMALVDGLIMGRATYEKVLTFGDWPYTKPVIVMSTSLSEAALPHDLVGKVRLSAESPKALMDRLAQEGWRHAYVDGGKLIQSFLRADLIDDMIITRLPVLLGTGIPLFGPLEKDIPLRHVETTAFASGLVQSKYAIARRP
ncbi:dihydrofolate reductase family protein [Reyranella sp. CPCC 100927]|uniref:dihydrofolate reductase family protein n=1 Tax=Reyranella sp. CPCC 100927 TaxID=2599616 RepID=UPI0011B3978D|nr:dihydrofolate reductase family protein [Reyranella sp. CPCC 100927]TWS99663.1 dihydrofolate reductase [Reyranella sp. CPCC 100927]